MCTLLRLLLLLRDRKCKSGMRLVCHPVRCYVSVREKNSVDVFIFEISKFLGSLTTDLSLDWNLKCAAADPAVISRAFASVALKEQSRITKDEIVNTFLCIENLL